MQVASIGHEIEAEEAIAREAWNKKVEVSVVYLCLTGNADIYIHEMRIYAFMCVFAREA